MVNLHIKSHTLTKVEGNKMNIQKKTYNEK